MRDVAAAWKSRRFAGQEREGQRRWQCPELCPQRVHEVRGWSPPGSAGEHSRSTRKKTRQKNQTSDKTGKELKRENKSENSVSFTISGLAGFWLPRPLSVAVCGLWTQSCHSQCPSCCPRRLNLDRGADSPQGVPAAPACHGCLPQPPHSSALNGESGSGWGWCCECLVALK